MKIRQEKTFVSLLGAIKQNKLYMLTLKKPHKEFSFYMCIKLKVIKIANVFISSRVQRLNTNMKKMSLLCGGKSCVSVCGWAELKPFL